MNIAQLKMVHAEFANLADVPDMAMASARIDPDLKFSTHCELLEAVAKFKPKQGWFTQRSKNHLLLAGQFAPDVQKDGHVLYGELVDEQGRAMHIRYRTAERVWQTTVFELVQGEDYLTDTIEFLCTDDEPRTLIYRRLWQLSNDHTAQVGAIFFHGFGKA